MIGAGLLPLVIAGCSSSGSETAPVTGSEELLQDHGFADIDAREIIDRLEALPVAERPQNLIASVTPSSVQLQDDAGREAEQKSTRLNSSHVAISYAVFCLKKKSLTNRRGTANNQPGKSGTTWGLGSHQER